MTATTGIAPRAEGAPRWRPLLWTAWRTHRALFAVLLALLAGMAGACLAAGLWLRGQCQAQLGHPCAAGAAAILPPSGAGTLASVLWRSLLALPVVAGVFAGAPLIAREYETGTFRFTRAQWAGLRRTTVAALLLTGAGTAAVACALSLAGAWQARPLLAASRWQPASFLTTAAVLPALALACVGAGALAGAAVRRVVPAMATALAAGIAVLAAAYRLAQALPRAGALAARAVPGFGLTGNFTGITSHGTLQWAHVPPAARRYALVPGYPGGQPGAAGSWQVSGWFTGARGQVLSARAVRELLRHLPVRLGFTGPPARIGAWLDARHVAYWVGYQPAGRYWLFQGAVAAILVAVAVAAAAGAVWLAGRRG